MSPALTASWSANGLTAPRFTIETRGSGSEGTLTEEGGEEGHRLPCASRHDAVAVSLTSPVSTSVCVTVWVPVAVQVSESPGANPGEAGVGQLTEPTVGSTTLTEASEIFPVFATRYE